MSQTQWALMVENVPPCITTTVNLKGFKPVALSSQRAESFLAPELAPEFSAGYILLEDNVALGSTQNP